MYLRIKIIKMDTNNSFNLISTIIVVILIYKVIWKIRIITIME